MGERKNKKAKGNRERDRQRRGQYDGQRKSKSFKGNYDKIEYHRQLQNCLSEQEQRRRMHRRMQRQNQQDEQGTKSASSSTNEQGLDVDAARRRQQTLMAIVASRLKDDRKEAEAKVCKEGSQRLLERMCTAREMSKASCPALREGRDFGKWIDPTQQSLMEICVKAIGANFKRFRSQEGAAEADMLWQLPETTVIDIAAAASVHRALNDTNVDLVLDNVEGAEDLMLYGHFSSSKLMAMQIRYSWTWGSGRIKETHSSNGDHIMPCLFVDWENEIDNNDDVDDAGGLGGGIDEDDDEDAEGWEDRCLEVRGFTQLRSLHLGSPALNGSFLGKMHKHFLSLRQLSVHDSLDENSGPGALSSIAQLPTLQFLDLSFCQWMNDRLVKDYCSLVVDSQKCNLCIWQTIGCSEVSSEASSPLLFETFESLGQVVFDELKYVPPALADRHFSAAQRAR